MANILLLDNLDSFTYNLVDQLRSLGNKVCIYRNVLSSDQIVNELNQIDNPILVLSPGPGTPSGAGCMMALLNAVRGRIPVLGVCLGFQAIVEAYGGSVAKAEKIMHGKTSQAIHDEEWMFLEMENPMLIGRYHSLIAKDIPERLVVNAHVDGVAMAVYCQQDRVCGFQFHPESILTPKGDQLMANTLKWLESR